MPLRYGLVLQDAVKRVLQQFNMDSNRVVVTGGSHGGFLTAHLIGQFPVSAMTNGNKFGNIFSGSNDVTSHGGKFLLHNSIESYTDMCVQYRKRVCYFFIALCACGCFRGFIKRRRLVIL